MLQKAFKVIGWTFFGLTMAGFISEAVEEIKEEQTEDTNCLDNIASFSRKIVKKGFEKDKNEYLEIKKFISDAKKNNKDLYDSLKVGCAGGCVYFAGLGIYKIMKRRKAHV